MVQYLFIPDDDIPKKPSPLGDVDIEKILDAVKSLKEKSSELNERMAILNEKIEATYKERRAREENR